jgi:hypothetical protein
LNPPPTAATGEHAGGCAAAFGRIGWEEDRPDRDRILGMRARVDAGIKAAIAACRPQAQKGMRVLSNRSSCRSPGVRLVIGNGAAKAIDDGLASVIARAIATRNMFLAGRDDSIDATMASRLGVRRGYLAVLVRLSNLSPEIVRAILVGHQPVELTPTRLVMLVAYVFGKTHGEIGIEIQRNAWWAKDYHISWLAGALAY